jgi:hypothetical protein
MLKNAKSSREGNQDIANCATVIHPLHMTAVALYGSDCAHRLGSAHSRTSALLILSAIPALLRFFLGRALVQGTG